MRMLPPRVKFLFAAAIILAAAIAFVWLGARLQRVSAERDRYKGNTAVLLSDMEAYRVRDSLSAARVESLELSIKEYERFRAADAEIIRELKAKNRDLAAVNKTQSQTIIELSAAPVDTVVIVRDSIRIPAVAVHCGDAWFDFDGVLTKDNFTGVLHNRDSLLIVETVKYKRFLGFLWKTKKVAARWVDAVSHNPHTEIKGLEYVVIEKK